MSMARPAYFILAAGTLLFAADAARRGVTFSLAAERSFEAEGSQRAADGRVVFSIEGAGSPSVNGDWVLAGVHLGRPRFHHASDSGVILQYDGPSKGWRFRKPRVWNIRNLGHIGMTLYTIRSDALDPPTEGWRTESGNRPVPRLVGNLLAKELDPDYMPSDLEAMWTQAHVGRGCLENADEPQVLPLKVKNGKSEPALQPEGGRLEDCLRLCAKTPTCMSVDWTSEDGGCTLFASGCVQPLYAERGVKSWVLKDDVLKERACASWNGKMSFMGEGWVHADAPESVLLDDLAKTFGGRCRAEDRIQVFYAEKDVGYATEGTLAANLKNTVLMYVNSDYKIFHSGVRLVGCGQSLLIQLQARAWGLENGFEVAFPYPVASPGSGKVWPGLRCNTPRGVRDQGAGTIIYYRVMPAKQESPWVRGETKILTVKSADIGEFLGGIVPYLSWWNVKGVYNPETLYWQPITGPKELIRQAVICHTFSLWLLGQAVAFVKGKGYDLKEHIQMDPRTEPRWNQHQVTVQDHPPVQGAWAKDTPAIGTYEELAAKSDGARLGMVRLLSPKAKDLAMLWETVKGYRDCDEPQTQAEMQELAARNWTDKDTWSSAKLGSDYRCTDRLPASSRGLGGTDMVRFGPRRFFPIRGETAIMSLEWDAHAFATYEVPFQLLDPATGAIRVPGGTPRGPFAEEALPNPCGKECPWEFPVPPPPPGGYQL